MSIIHEVEIAFFKNDTGMTHANPLGFKTEQYGAGYGEIEVGRISVEFVLPLGHEEIANAERLALTIATESMGWFGEHVAIRWWIDGGEYHLRVEMKPQVFSSQYVIAHLDEWHYHCAGYVKIEGVPRSVNRKPQPR